MKNEQGFTLIEVVTSLVIISIILLGFSSIIIQSNDHANLNSEKLVATNLADAYLERLRIEGKKLTITTEEICEDTQKIGIICREFTLNNNIYPIEIEIINDNENNLALQNIVVTVKTPDKRAHAKVEGYITYE